MPRMCCVPACRNKQEDIILHRFPANKELCNVWLLNIKICDTLKMDRMGILRRKFVCHNHFEKRFVKVSRRLKTGAYPTLFTEKEMSTGIPSGDISAYVSSYNTIHLCGNSISVVYDPPHLIKGMRNNMLSKHIIFEGNVTTWQDIVDVYNTDCSHGESRIMHKLTDEHVIPEKIRKMKVKNCVQVFSKTVSAENADPTENAVCNFRIVAMKTNEYLEQHANEQNIGRKIKEKLLAEYSFDLISCDSHSKVLVEDFISTIVKLYIHNWCKIINKILKGVDIIRTEGKTLPKMQNLALRKYKKKLKNKKLNK